MPHLSEGFGVNDLRPLAVEISGQQLAYFPTLNSTSRMASGGPAVRHRVRFGRSNLAHNSHTEGYALRRPELREVARRLCRVWRYASASAPQEVHLVGPVPFSGLTSE